VEVCSGLTHVDNSRTSIPILFLQHTRLAIVGIRYALSTTNDTLALKASVITFIAYFNLGLWSDIGIANDALSIAILAQLADGNARLLSAHDQIGMMTNGHFFVLFVEDDDDGDDDVVEQEAKGTSLAIQSSYDASGSTPTRKKIDLLSR